MNRSCSEKSRWHLEKTWIIHWTGPILCADQREKLVWALVAHQNKCHLAFDQNPLWMHLQSTEVITHRRSIFCRRGRLKRLQTGCVHSWECHFHTVITVSLMKSSMLDDISALPQRLQCKRDRKGSLHFVLISVLPTKEETITHLKPQSGHNG